ncbi:MAG: hypothetical protein ACYSTY_06750 [Planctomycetota bacterium]|jgi:hypothetical protein
MFRFGEPDLGAVNVIHEGRFAALMRDANGAWFQHDASHRHGGEGGAAPAPADQHVADPERSAEITERMALTARMIADRRVQPERSLDAYGLVNPKTMIAFYGRAEDGADYARPLDVLYVGDLVPTEYAYYSMLGGDPELSLIPRFYVALLLGLVYGEDQAPTPLPLREGREQGDETGGPQFPRTINE